MSARVTSAVVAGTTAGAGSGAGWRRPADQPSPSATRLRAERAATVPRRARRGGLTAGDSARRLDQEEGLPVLDGVPVLDEDLRDAPADLRLDLVHELHRLDDAHDLPLLHDVALAHVGVRVRGRRAVEGADHRRL